LYIDIKFGFKVHFAHLMEILAADWGLAQQEQCQERELGPTQEPQVGWNISPTYGPVYLLQEKYSQQLKNKKDMGNDGHYFVTASNITVAYTRCWEWQKGFKGDPAANERRATTMLQSLPQAVAAAMDARRDLGQDEAGALPGGELISDDVQASITNNSFEDIMEAIRNERHYSDISAED
ncbi:unnamed protein product, partial [Symbiodinium microadriaticum]